MAFVRTLFICCWFVPLAPMFPSNLCSAITPPPFFLLRGRSCGAGRISWQQLPSFLRGAMAMPKSHVFSCHKSRGDNICLSGCDHYFAPSFGVKFASLYSLKCECFVWLFCICGRTIVSWDVQLAWIFIIILLLGSSDWALYCEVYVRYLSLR